MALNKWGMGFVLGAKDMASGVIGKVGAAFSNLTKQSKESEKASLRQAAAMRATVVGGALSLWARGTVKDFRALITESREFGKKLNGVFSLVDENLFSKRQIQDIAMRMAGLFGGDVLSQMDAMRIAVQMGYKDTAASAELMTAANRLAIASQSDLTVSTTALTAAMANYSKQGATYTSVSDQMMAATRSGRVSVEELASALQTIGPAASQVGVSIEEIIASITTATQRGMSADQATTGLKAILLSMLKQSSATKKASKELGVDFSKAALQSKGFAGMLEALGGAAAGSEDTMSRMFRSLEGSQMVMAVTSDGGKTYADTLGSITKSAGKTDTAFGKLTASTGFQSRRLDAYGKNLRILFGQSLDRLFKPFVTLAARIAEALDKMVQSLPPEFVDAITALAVALTAVTGLVGGALLLAGAMSMLGITIANVATSLMVLTVVVPLVLVLIGGLAVAAYSAYRSFQKNAGGIATSWEDMVKKIKLGAEGMMAILKGEKFSKELEKSLGKEENRGVARFLRGFELATERVERFWAGLKKGFEEGAAALGDSPAMKGLKDTFDNVFSLFTGPEAANSESALKGIEDSGAKTGKRLAELGEIAINTITKLVELGGAFMGFVANISAEDISSAINTAITSFRGLWTTLMSIVEVLGWVASAVQLVVNTIQFLGAFVAETMAFMIKSVMVGYKIIARLMSGNFKGAFSAAKTGGRELFTTNPFEESTKQFGDIVKVFNPQSTVGDVEAANRSKQQNVESMMRARESAAAILVQQREAGENTDTITAMLATLNNSILELSKRPPPPLNVTIDADQVAASTRAANKRDADRELAYSEGMVF